MLTKVRGIEGVGSWQWMGPLCMRSGCGMVGVIKIVEVVDKVMIQCTVELLEACIFYVINYESSSCCSPSYARNIVKNIPC